MNLRLNDAAPGHFNDPESSFTVTCETVSVMQ